MLISIELRKSARRDYESDALTKLSYGPKKCYIIISYSLRIASRFWKRGLLGLSCLFDILFLKSIQPVAFIDIQYRNNR